MNNKIKELIKAYDKIIDKKLVHERLNIATTLREEIQIIIKEISKNL